MTCQAIEMYVPERLAKDCLLVSAENGEPGKRTLARKHTYIHDKGRQIVNEAHIRAA